MSSTAKLSARERIETLLDDNSFVEIGALVTKRSTDFNLLQSEAPGDGVITGYGVIDNKPVYVYAQDASALGGSIGEMHARKITALYDRAMKVGAPVIGLIDCAGFRLQESTDALEGFGAIYTRQSLASGVIPQITAVYGNCGGGLSVLTALSDFTFISKEGRLYVNAPNAIDDNYVGKCDTADAAFAAKAGIVDFVHDDEEASLNAIRKLVSFLPLNNEDEVSTEMNDDLNRELETFDSNLKDIKPAITDLADQDDFLEIKADYAPDMIIGLIKLNGSPVGVVANNDTVLTTKGCYKAEKFVRFCDAFDIPVVTITNVTGFASSMNEAGSIGIAAAKLSYAFADATVPKINVIAGKAYGSAYITMNSKSLGADLVFALADAEVGPMDADLAAQIVYADEIESAGDKAAVRKEKAAEYKKMMLASENAAKRGYVDAIIEGSEVRKQLIYALEMLYTKREDRPVRKHGSVL